MVRTETIRTTSTYAVALLRKYASQGDRYKEGYDIRSAGLLWIGRGSAARDKWSCKAAAKIDTELVWTISLREDPMSCQGQSVSGAEEEEPRDGEQERCGFCTEPRIPRALPRHPSWQRRC
jgi:hypothetical protein